MLLICEDSEVALQESSSTVLYYIHVYMVSFQFPLLDGSRSVNVPSPRCHAAESSWWQCWGLRQLSHKFQRLEDDASKCIKMLHQCIYLFPWNVPFHIQILTYTLQGVTVVTATKNAEINELVHRNTQPRQMMLGTEMKDHVISLSQHSQQQSESLKAWSIRQSLLKGQLQVHLKEQQWRDFGLFNISPLDTNLWNIGNMLLMKASIAAHLKNCFLLRFCCHQVPSHNHGGQDTGPLNCLKMIQWQGHQVVKRCRKGPACCLIRILVPKVRQSASWSKSKQSNV